MNTRPLGDTLVHEVGLGAWQLGADWGDVSDTRAAEILRAAHRAGVDFVDTADVYGAGRSEARIGAYCAESGWRPFIATKLGRLHGYPDGYSLELFRQCCQGSIGRLGTPALALTQLHCVPTAVLAEGQVFDWLRDLQQEGLICRFGASVESTEEARICLRQPGLASLQVIFNLLRPEPISDIFAEAADRGVAIIVRLPLASGLLSGRFSAETAFPEGDHRHYNRDGAAFNVGETFAGLPLSVGAPLVSALPALLPGAAPLAQRALRWILDHPEVTVVIPGASRPEQVRANVAAAGLPPFSAGTHAALRGWAREQVAPHIRGPR